MVGGLLLGGLLLSGCCSQGLAPNYYSVTLPMVKTMPTAVARMLRAIFAACTVAKSVGNVLLSVMWVQELQLEVLWRSNAAMATGAVWGQTKLLGTGWCETGRTVRLLGKQYSSSACRTGRPV